jgi:hypothetical protein
MYSMLHPVHSAREAFHFLEQPCLELIHHAVNDFFAHDLFLACPTLPESGCPCES